MARWIQDDGRFGIQGLNIGKSPGRPPKVDADAKAALQEALAHHPRALGYAQATWTLGGLQDYLRQSVQVSVHVETIRQAIKRMGYRHKRPKLSLQHKQDVRDVQRARRPLAAALKKVPPTQSDMPSSSKTNANSISIPA